MELNENTEIDVSKFKPSLRRLNEVKVNKFIDQLDNVDIKSLLEKPLKRPSFKRPLKKRSINNTVKMIIQTLHLLDEPDYEKRLEAFVGYCRILNFNYNTVQSYITQAKSNGLFGKEQINLRIDPTLFVGKPHVRIVSVEKFLNMFNYIMNNFSKYNSPLAIACFTGLRTNEILQFTSATLFQLKEHYINVNIKRKKVIIDNDIPIFWKPIYHKRFDDFINLLINLYNDEYSNYLKHKISINLFNVTPTTLRNRTINAYLKANNELPPRGFGIHSCRYMIATIMSNESDNLPNIQQFLQHKSFKTTQRYINLDTAFVKEQFDKITNKEFKGILDFLNKNVSKD